jgi:hypothetical protein
MTRPVFTVRCLALVLPTAFLLFVPSSRPARATDLELAISGNYFTVNGTARFLVFVSYFDALDVKAASAASGASEALTRRSARA